MGGNTIRWGHSMYPSSLNQRPQLVLVYFCYQNSSEFPLPINYFELLAGNKLRSFINFSVPRRQHSGHREMRNILTEKSFFENLEIKIFYEPFGDSDKSSMWNIKIGNSKQFSRFVPRNYAPAAFCLASNDVSIASNRRKKDSAAGEI